MNPHTRDLIALVTSAAFTVTVCLLIAWHVVNGVALDGSDMMLIGVMVALIAASTGIQLPGVVNRVNGAGNLDASTTTTTTTRSSAPPPAHPAAATPTDDPPTPTPT